MHSLLHFSLFDALRTVFSWVFWGENDIKSVQKMPSPQPLSHSVLRVILPLQSVRVLGVGRGANSERKGHDVLRKMTLLSGSKMDFPQSVSTGSKRGGKIGQNSDQKRSFKTSPQQVDVRAPNYVQNAIRKMSFSEVPEHHENGMIFPTISTYFLTLSNPSKIRLNMV